MDMELKLHDLYKQLDFHESLEYLPDMQGVFLRFQEYFESYSGKQR